MILKHVVLIFVAIATYASSFSARQAFADQRCRDVRLVVGNHTDSNIRIYKIRYFDIEDGKWRTNDVPNLTVGPPLGGTALAYVRTETLEYVGNEEIGDVRFQFKKGNNGARTWSSPAPSGIQRCVRGNEIRHTISE